MRVLGRGTYPQAAASVQVFLFILVTPDDKGIGPALFYLMLECLGESLLDSAGTPVEVGLMVLVSLTNAQVSIRGATWTIALRFRPIFDPRG